METLLTVFPSTAAEWGSEIDRWSEYYPVVNIELECKQVMKTLNPPSIQHSTDQFPTSRLHHCWMTMSYAGYIITAIKMLTAFHIIHECPY